MLGLKKSHAQNLLIDVKKLEEPKLKGTFYIGFIVKLAGLLDEKRGLISGDGARISSPWIARKQNSYNRYSAVMYKVAAEIMKPAYIQRQKVNDELKKYKDELKEAKEMLHEEVQTIAQKRKEANAQKDIKALEVKMAEKFCVLKELKICIDEAEHQLNQMLQEKKLIVESQILHYIRGAKKRANATELLAENEVSKSLFQAFGNEFAYCFEEEAVFGNKEKERAEDERIQ